MKQCTKCGLSFNFISAEDEEFKQCWSLSNLQPLWAADNIRKGGDYSEHESKSVS